MNETNTAGSAPSGTVTLADLHSGRRARITERECEQITGRGRFSLQRDRVARKGIPFQKDLETGRIWYTAADVLAYLDNPKHLSTSEYDTSAQLPRLAAARSELARRRASQSA